jgi:hypothetical protein
MSDYGHVRHHLKKALENFREVKDPGLGMGLRKLTRGLNRLNNQLDKINKSNKK